MTGAEPQTLTKLVYNTGMNIESEQFLFACRGSFDSALTDNILFLTESNLHNLDRPKIAKKVYYLLVEGLQNITRHQGEDFEHNAYSGGYFIIQRKDEAYSITYGNAVSKETRGQLIERLEDIRSKESSELKEYYMDLLNNSGFSTKGGAGLGLVDMARKSSGKIHFDFVPKGKDFFYYLNLTIKIDDEQYSEDLGETYLKEAQECHEQMVRSEAIMLFKGLLNPENINHLGVQIDSALKSDVKAAGVSMVMNELLRNMAKHAYNRYNQAGKPGVFLLRKSSVGYQMVSGNFIIKEKQGGLEQSLSSVNRLTTNELQAFLEAQAEKSVENHANGLARLRSITGHSFEHEFIEQDNQPPFFILKIAVNH